MSSADARLVTCTEAVISPHWPSEHLRRDRDRHLLSLRRDEATGEQGQLVVDGQRRAERLRRRAAGKAIALMAAAEILVLEEGVEVALDLCRFEIPRRPPATRKHSSRPRRCSAMAATPPTWKTGRTS